MTSTFSAALLLLREIGAARIAREHDLEQARQPHAVLDQLVDVAHAERPVRHAHRQTVDRDLGHEAFGHDLELDRVIVQPLRARQLLDAGKCDCASLRSSRSPHAACCWPKKCRTAFQMSSVPLTRYAPTLSVVARELDEQLADLAVRRGAGERRDFEEAGVVAVADQLLEREPAPAAGRRGSSRRRRRRTGRRCTGSGCSARR